MTEKTTKFTFISENRKDQPVVRRLEMLEKFLITYVIR